MNSGPRLPGEVPGGGAATCLRALCIKFGHSFGRLGGGAEAQLAGHPAAHLLGLGLGLGLGQQLARLLHLRATQASCPGGLLPAGLLLLGGLPAAGRLHPRHLLAGPLHESGLLASLLGPPRAGLRLRHRWRPWLDTGMSPPWPRARWPLCARTHGGGSCGTLTSETHHLRRHQARAHRCT